MPGRALLIAAMLVIGACGRVGFDQRVGGDDATPAQIRYVGPVEQAELNMGSSDGFTVKAAAAGDLVALQMACNTATAPTAISVTAPGWTFSMPVPVTNIDTLYATMAYATAPDTSPVTVTVTWSGTICDLHDILGDELSGNRVPGPIDVFDQHAGTDTCISQLTTTSDGDAVWAACTSLGFVTGVGPGAAPGANDGDGDRAAYKLTSDPAGTIETLTMPNTGSHVISALAIRPR